MRAIRNGTPARGLLAGSVLLVALPTAAAETSDLESRIEELERRQTEMFRQQISEEGRVRPFLGRELLLGGYFETGIQRLGGPNMGVQTSASSHLLGINLAATLADQDRFVTQVQTGIGFSFLNRHSDPRVTAAPTRQYSTSTAATLMAQGYYEHRFDTAFNVQLGLGYVPFGIAYQYREPQVFRRRGGEGAQMVSQSATQDGGVTSVGVAFPLWMGAHFLGSLPVGSSRWGYHAYTFTPTTNSKTVGVGARLWLKWGEYLTLGTSAQRGETKRDYHFRSYGADADLKYGPYGVTVEYARSRFSGGGPDAPYSYYASPYVEFFQGKFLVYGFVDYLDNPTNVTQTTGFPADPYKRLDAGGGVNWLPIPTTRFRLGYSRSAYRGPSAVIDPKKRGYSTVDLSTALAF